MDLSKSIIGLSIKRIFINILFVSAFILFSGGKPIGKSIKPTEITAVSASDFLNSIGVNSAVSRRGEHLEKTIEIIKYMGIRWIRSGYEGDAANEDYITLHRQTGVRFSYGLMSGGTDIPKLLSGGRMLAAAGALLAFEGPNEPNNWPIIYKGNKGGKDVTWMPVAQLQADLYKAVKNDSLLKKYPVWSLSENGAQTDNMGLQFLEIPKGAGTMMPEGTKYADFANCHNYFLHPAYPYLYDNQTWNAADPGSRCKVDGLYGNYGLTWKTTFKGYSEADLTGIPKVTTETGLVIDGKTDEEKQGRLYLNLYLAQYKRNWSYTSVYLLRDRSDENGNQTFGFYKPDYTPRKSAIYLHNLTTILADNGSIKNAGKLAYSIANQPETVHELLLQKSTGIFELVIWGEKATGSDEIKISLGKPSRYIKIYDPTINTEPIRTLKNAGFASITLSDHPLVIEL